jgi:uncharacterized protein (DUF2384 family)
MDIDDILRQPRFKDLDNFLNEEMTRVAGKELVARIGEIFKKEDVRNWFYSSIIALDGNRPYDYCKDGKREEVTDILERIEHGVYS